MAPLFSKYLHRRYYRTVVLCTQMYVYTLLIANALPLGSYIGTVEYTLQPPYFVDSPQAVPVLGCVLLLCMTQVCFVCRAQQPRETSPGQGRELSAAQGGLSCCGNMYI